MSPTGTPRTESAWRTVAEKLWGHEWPNKTLYNLTIVLNSASKLDEEQFIALRIIWKQKREFVAGKWGINTMTRAREYLHSLGYWNEYVKAISESFDRNIGVPEKLGTFALVWYQQKLVAKGDLNEASQPKVEIRRVTRSADKAQHDQESSQSPAVGYVEIASDGDDESQVATQQCQVFPSPGPTEITSTTSPPAEDEQLVNTSFINFLQAISFHFPTLQCQWTNSQHMYRFNQGEATFTAKVDGRLETKDRPLESRQAKKAKTAIKATKATIEVKPYVRSSKQTYVRYEESAQMAALIFCEPDAGINDGKKYYRVAVSQDRHEMWLKIAVYDSHYVRYLQNEMPADSTPSFLRMYEFGPYDVTIPKKVEEFAVTILAIMLQDGELDFTFETGDDGAGNEEASGSDSPLSSPPDLAADLEGTV